MVGRVTEVSANQSQIAPSKNLHKGQEKNRTQKPNYKTVF